MNKFIRVKLYLILLLLIFFSHLELNILFKYFYGIELFNSNKLLENNEISIVVDIKNLSKNKHILFNDVMKALNSTRNFYFVKTNGNLDQNIFNIVENSSVKIIQSNFPDSIFLPLVVSLYGNAVPEYVLLIEGDELKDNCGINLIKWIKNAYKKIKENEYDYIFGNYQIINKKKIGSTILFSRASLIEHLLYYTDSDTTHINPFIQFSLATQTKFCCIKFKDLILSKLHINGKRFSLNMECPSTKDKEKPSLCIMLPNFKRNYLYSSFKAFTYQIYKPKFYIIIQNENRISYNISSIKKMVNEPVYHIWMQNWNSFFYLNLRLSSVLPCDFILKYDDDQWPIDNTIQERLIALAKNKNYIIGQKGFSIKKSYCGYSPKNFNKIGSDVVDHASVPLLIRPGYIKLDARNNIYRLYGGEDITLSLNSYKLCNVTSKTVKMKLFEKQKDGNNQRSDKKIISSYKSEIKSFNLFSSTYCYLIRSGYIPRRWNEFKIPLRDYLNITITHKRLT